MNTRVTILAAAIALAGCTTVPPATSNDDSDDIMASVALVPKSGSNVSGSLHVMAMGDGVHVSGSISGLAPNSAHGFHIHETGNCGTPDASSAGGHFNPTHEAHGRAAASPHHLGDQDNIVADASGVARVDAHFAGATLGKGKASDVLGKAVIVHADPDDYTSQPSGNAGKRIACGVITPG